MLCHSNPQSVAAVCDDLAFAAIMEACDLAESFALSAREAAWRGNRQLLECHLRELRAATVAAIGGYKLLSTPFGNDGGAPHASSV